MRNFGPVVKAKACSNPVCTNIAPVSDDRNYTPQTVVTYTGSTLEFTYCSNRCVNADVDRSSALAEAQSHYWAHIMASYEDADRMMGAHLAAFIEDAERTADKIRQTISPARRAYWNHIYNMASKAINDTDARVKHMQASSYADSRTAEYMQVS